jgi:RNase_H superfamily
MSDLTGKNIVVIDVETANSAEDCLYCGLPEARHTAASRTNLLSPCVTFSPLGWDNKAALGLSIGGYYDYQTGCITWFDVHSLSATIQALVQRQPLLVSFNGIGFDGPLMQTVGNAAECVGALYTWPALWQRSYDLLAEIWRVDEEGKYTKGLNSLDAICGANDLGRKTGDGAQAPRDWRAGRVSTVVNYLQNDIFLTKRLFELILEKNGTIQRSTGPITLRLPARPHYAA